MQENEEFLLPLEDGRAGIQGLQVYRVSDIVETFLMPILEFQIEQAEEYRKMNPDSEYLPAGAPQFPDNLPMQAAVDLNTYFADRADGAPYGGKVRRPPGLAIGS